MENEKAKPGCIWKSVAAGALGGLTASFAMNQFQALLSSAEKELSRDAGSQQQQDQGSSGEDATVKTVQALSEKLRNRKLSYSEKQWAGSAVHYAFGTAMGATYGALAHSTPAVSAGRGAAYGAALWLAADEIAVPAAGLAAPLAQTPLSSHVSALAAHLVYGFVTDLVRRSVSP